MRNKSLLWAAIVCFLIAGFFLYLIIDANADTSGQATHLLGYYVIHDYWYWSGEYNIRAWHFFDGFPRYGYEDFKVAVDVYYAVVGGREEHMCKFFDHNRDGVKDSVHCLPMFRQNLPRVVLTW